MQSCSESFQFQTAYDCLLLLLFFFVYCILAFMHNLCSSHQLSCMDECHLVTTEHSFWMLHWRYLLLIKLWNTNFHQHLYSEYSEANSLAHPHVLWIHGRNSNGLERGPWGDTVSSICKTISCLNLERFFRVETGNNSADRKRHKWTLKNC